MHHLSVQTFPADILSKDVSFAQKRCNSKLTECLDSIGTSNSYLISFGAVSGLFKVDAKPQLLIKYKVSNTCLKFSCGIL